VLPLRVRLTPEVMPTSGIGLRGNGLGRGGGEEEEEDKEEEDEEEDGEWSAEMDISNDDVGRSRGWSWRCGDRASRRLRAMLLSVHESRIR